MAQKTNSGITISQIRDLPVADHPTEIVERKGRGHPDSICDHIMDCVSVALCKEYLKKAGFIAHHNIDKSFLVAGKSEVAFGGGKIIDPMLMIFGDRATWKIDGQDIAVDKIAIATAKKWFKQNMRFVNPEAHMRYQVELKPGSEELTDIFKRSKKGAILGANDTSAAVGYAPLSPTELAVLELERFLNSKSFKKRFPEAGEDIKIMGVRQNSLLHLTIAMALVDRFIKDEKDYFRKKDEILAAAQQFIKEKLRTPLETKLYLNTLDVKGRGTGGAYLTVLGTSAEAGDSGQIGRGNRVNGLIALNRPMGTEAAAGKNPVSHVGKIYNFLAHKVASEIQKNVHEIKEVYVWLCSQIGAPVNQPKIASAQLVLEKGAQLEKLVSQVQEIFAKELKDIHLFCRDLSNGKCAVC